jgi:hypothetical protein
MKRIIYIIILFSFSRQVLGQTNLVPNWSFEMQSSCPTTSSQLYLAIPWFLGPSTDLFDSCAPISSNLNVPYVVGPNHDTAYAKNGHALIGMHSYYNGREYAQVKLTDTLKPNACYYVDFYTRRYILCDWAINNIAANLSTVPFTNPSAPLQVPMHITRYGNPVIKDTSNWVQIAGLYKAVGGESYITLGNFQTDSNTTANLIYNNGVGCGYYLFDAVAVYSLNPAGILPWSYTDTTIILGNSVYIGNYIGGNFNPVWYTYSGNFIANNSGITVTPTITSQYIIQFTVCGVPRADTIKVTVINDVGIVEQSINSSDLIVSPNPNNGLINLSISNKDFLIQNSTVKIYDIFNREVKTLKLLGKNQDLPLQDINNGVYYLQLYQGEKMLLTKKIIKQ